MKMTRREFKNLIFECYVEYLRKQNRLLNEDKDKETNMVFKEAQVLPDAMEQILAKFPNLRNCLINLCTEDFGKFIAGIDWVSPRPTSFRINLKNGQDFTLTWMGENFKANISGKDYYLGELSAKQQALHKLSILFQEGPVGPPEEEMGEEGPGGDEGPGGGGGGFGGGGDFPGAEEMPGGGGEEGGPEAGGEGEDMGDEDIDFEADSAI